MPITYVKDAQAGLAKMKGGNLPLMLALMQPAVDKIYEDIFVNPNPEEVDAFASSCSRSENSDSEGAALFEMTQGLAWCKRAAVLKDSGDVDEYRAALVIAIKSFLKELDEDYLILPHKDAYIETADLPWYCFIMAIKCTLDMANTFIETKDNVLVSFPIKSSPFIRLISLGAGACLVGRTSLHTHLKTTSTRGRRLAYVIGLYSLPPLKLPRI